MSTRARISAPAKVNLSLTVIDRRADGYHVIDSVFAPVDLSDEIEVLREASPAGAIRLECDDDRLPRDSGNLVWRAVEVFYGGRAPRPAVSIRLAKRIPAGAGLGGGSSDAAAVLRALARLDGEPDDPPELVARAARIGADVPFFLWCRPARVRGTGEIVEPLRSFSSQRLVIVWPGFAVETRWAYAALDRTLTWPRGADTIPPFRVGGRYVTNVHNDFEAVVGERFPRVLEWKARLASLGALSAGLSGSGSAVFGVFRDQQTADRAAGGVRAEGVWAVSVRTLDGPPPVEVEGR